MLARIGRDRALRSLPLWGIAALVNTSVLLSMTLWWSIQREASVSTPVLLLVGWSGVAVYLAFGNVRTRCTDFDLSLPVPARNLWLAHVLAVLLGGALIVVLAVSALALHRSLVGDRIALDQGPVALAALLGAGLVLATLLLQAPRPNLPRIPLTRGNIGWTVCVLAVVPVLMSAASLAGPLGAIPVLLLALVVGTWLYRTIPPAFALVPLEPAAAADDVAVVATAPTVGQRRRFPVVALTIFRSVSAGFKELLLVPFLVMFAFILGGGLELAQDGDLRDLRFMYFTMTTYMLFAFLGPRLRSLHHLDPLPIARRPVVAVLILPYLPVLCAGYGAGVIAASGTRAGIEYVNFQETDDGYEVTVPLRVYEVAWNGVPPSVDSPWGESRAPAPVNPWPESRPVIYSPFGAPPGSSARFVALQISRAVAATYGESIPPDEIAARYLVTNDEGAVVPRGDELTLRQDYPGLRARSGPMFPVLLAIVVVPWLLLSALLLRAYRACVGEWVRQTIMWGSLGVLMLGWLVPAVCSFLRVVEPWVWRGVVEIPVMRLGETVTGTAAAWVVAALLIAGSYLVAQSQFLRMEIPTRPSKYSLVDCMLIDR